MKLRLRLCVFFVLLGLLLPLISHSMHAQSNATISGRVTDRSGAVVADARIVVENISIHISHNTIVKHLKSGADGSYSMELPPGEYRIRIEHAQMASSERKFTLAAGERRRWDAQLELAALASTVVVSAAAEPAPANAVASPVTVLTRSLSFLVS